MEKQESRFLKPKKTEKKRHAENIEGKRRQRIKTLRKCSRKIWGGEFGIQH